MKLRAWNTNPNALVARIGGNEPQLENSTTSALKQRDVNVDFLEVPAGRIKDAHEELYKRLANARESYDVIVPDMELVSSHLFRRTPKWLTIGDLTPFLSPFLVPARPIRRTRCADGVGVPGGEEWL
jgi:hypothetical protein